MTAPINSADTMPIQIGDFAKPVSLKIQAHGNIGVAIFDDLNALKLTPTDSGANWLEVAPDAGIVEISWVGKLFVRSSSDTNPAEFSYIVTQCGG